MKFLGILALVGLVAFKSASGAPCDATTGATVKIKSITTTATTAVIMYTEGFANGRRSFQYGIGALGPVNPVQSRNRSVHPQTLTELTPNTKYMYRFHGFFGGRDNRSIVTGTFTTDGTTCGEIIPTTGKVEGFVLNHSKDTIQNVKVSIDSAGKIIVSDTTDEKGKYTFNLKPFGNYKLVCAYPPFTAPAPATVPAVSVGKAYTLSNQVLTGAYQLSGTVKLPDGLDKAVITIVHKTDATQNRVVDTDEEGSFYLGLKAGEYTLNAVSGTKTLEAPMNVSILLKSVKLNDIILSATSSIKLMPKQGKFTGSSAVNYNVKGAKQINKSAGQTQVIHFSK